MLDYPIQQKARLGLVACIGGATPTLVKLFLLVLRIERFLATNRAVYTQCQIYCFSKYVSIKRMSLSVFSKEAHCV